MSAEPPPLPARPLLPVLTDFGDWLSPMIVKELRQGLRTWVFVGAFIVLQAVLVMTLMISFSSGNQEAASYFFWILVAFILVFIVPLRGYNALSGEIKAQTLDALVLTRLSAFRIAFGKWAALVLQAGLIAISVLPYVVLRYFGGGVNLINELRALLIFWMLSAAVTSVAVACSALPSVIVRTLMLLATWWWALLACGALTTATLGPEEFGLVRSLTPAPEAAWLILVAVLVPLWAYGCYFVIDMGASQIAPIAANHATRKRLISLAFILAALGFVLGLHDNDGQELAFFCLMAIWGLSSIDCLTETPTTAVSVYAPFVKHRLAGRIAGVLLAPGWPAGVLFFLLTSTLVFGGWRVWQLHVSAQNAIALANIPGCALAPLALALLCFRGQPRMLGPFLVCGLILVIFGALLMLMTGISHEDNVAYLGMISAPTALMTASLRGAAEQEAIFTGGLISTLGSLAIILLHAFPHYRAMFAAMREASALGKKADDARRV